jgi:hypothetical protein
MDFHLMLVVLWFLKSGSPTEATFDASIWTNKNLSGVEQAVKSKKLLFDLLSKCRKFQMLIKSSMMHKNNENILGNS